MNFRIKRGVVSNLLIGVFLLLVLFVPNRADFIRIYYIVLLGGGALLVASTKKLYFDYLSLIGIGIIFFHTFFTLIRFGFIVDPNIRDYTEVIRLTLPVLLLVFRDRFKYLKLSTIFFVFAFYTSIACFVSVLDFANIDFANIVSISKSIYVESWHSNEDYRMFGLSAGPGQHGVIMLVCFTFFYCRVFQREKMIAPLLFSCIAMLSLFLSQTRTTIIGFAVIAVAVPLFYLIFGKQTSRRRAIPILSSFILIASYLVIRFYSFFSRLFDILGGLGDVTSFQTRLETYETLFNKALEFPVFFFLGYGKEFFKTSVFDNEYLMLFFIYGPIITIILLVGVVIYLVYFLAKKEKCEYESNTILFFLTTVGLLVAFPAYFFLHTTILPLIFIFINMAYWENRSFKKPIA